MAMKKVKITGDELARGLGRYTAVYERDGDGWLVEIAEVPSCHTSGDSLSRARSKIREALSLWVDDAATAEIVDDVRLPAGTRRSIAKALRARALAEAKALEAQESTRAMVSSLRDLGLSTRDAAELTSLSQQRIAQLSTS